MNGWYVVQKYDPKFKNIYDAVKINHNKLLDEKLKLSYETKILQTDNETKFGWSIHNENVTQTDHNPQLLINI